MVCSSCGLQKAEVHVKKSKLVPNHPLYMCNSCVDKKFEPRYVIIIAARNGVDVYDYVWHHRYVGADILGKEVLVKK